MAGGKSSYFCIISIRTPRVGSNYSSLSLGSTASLFQSALPVWGAMTMRGESITTYIISIRTPRWGAMAKTNENPL